MPEWAKSKTFWIAAGSLAAVLLLIANLSTRPDDGKTVIRYAQGSGVAQQPIVYEIEREFERLHPDIDVKIEFYPRSFWLKLKTMIAADAAPDSYEMWPTKLPDYARRGMLEPLDPYIERDGLDLNEYYPAAIESLQYEGNQYAIPFQVSGIVIYYNPDLFEEAGVDPPDWETDWEGLREIARKLTRDLDGDGVTDQYGMLFSYNFERGLGTLFAQAGADVIGEDGWSALDTSEAKQALDYLLTLYREDKTALIEGIGASGHMDTGSLFESGRIAMTFDGSWALGTYNRAGHIRAEIAPLPMGPNGHRGMLTNPLGNMINRNSLHKDATWEWVKFYSDEIAQRLTGEMKRGIPAMRRIAEEPGGAFLKEGDPPENKHVFLEQMQWARDLWPTVGWTEWMTMLHQRTSSAYEGYMTSEEALASMGLDIDATIRRALERTGPNER